MVDCYVQNSEEDDLFYAISTENDTINIQINGLEQHGLATISMTPQEAKHASNILKIYAEAAEKIIYGEVQNG